MTRGLRRTARLLLGALIAFSCAKSEPDRGGLMLLISQDGPLGLDRLDAQVSTPEGARLFDGSYRIPDEVGLPTTLAIVSNGKPTATALIRVSGWKDGVPLDVRDAIVRQIPVKDVAALRIVLSGRCSRQVTLVDGQATTRCGDGSGDQTCDPASGQCTSAEVDGSTLKPYEAGAESQQPDLGAGGVAAGDGNAAGQAGADNAGAAGAAGACSCAQGSVCVQGTCSKLACAPNERFCSGDSLRECAADGLSSVEVQTCDADSYCSSDSVASCQPRVCTPKSGACSVNSVLACADDGSGYREVASCSADEHCDATSVGCVSGACPFGRGDCTADAGCETALGTVMNCLGCGDACKAVHGKNACGASGCEPSCDDGYEDCNGNPNDGCETDLTSDPKHCGSCKTACSLLNATAACVDGECAVDECTGTFGDCTSAAGCETDLSRSVQHCGDCMTACSKTGATAVSCTDGKCDPPTCDATHLDCDGRHENGCEADLTSANECGACSHACDDTSPNCVGVDGTYGCQAAVSYVNDVEAVASGTTLNLAHSLAVGTNRLVLAAVVTESTNTSGLAGARPTAVTYGSVPMNHDATLEYGSDTGAAAFTNPYIYYYYLTDTGSNVLPPSGMQTLTVSGTANKLDAIAAQVVEFAGVDQMTPLLVGSGIRMADSGAACVLTGAVTTTLPGTALYVASVGHFSGVATVTGSELMSAPIWNPPMWGTQERAYASYGGTDSSVLAPATYTVGFTYQWCNPGASFPVGIQPYRP